MELTSNNKKLNMKERYFYRKEFETLLKTEFKDQKVRISKDLLEQLLFEEIVLNKEKNIVIKLPIWSGDFLQNIDLSNVDFSNVSWTALKYLEKNNEIFDEVNINKYYQKLNGNVNVPREELNKDIEFYRETYEKENKNFFLDYIMSIVPSELLDDKALLLERIKEISSVYRDIKMHINYSNTNANIDLSQSIEAKMDESLCVCDCDFNGCNVYISQKSEHIYFRKVNFSNSKINLPRCVDDESIGECLFENCDLSKTMFDITTMLSEGMNLNGLKNSKAKLCYKEARNAYYLILKQKFLTGCYIGDELVDNLDMLPEQKKK